MEKKIRHLVIRVQRGALPTEWQIEKDARGGTEQGKLRWYQSLAPNLARLEWKMRSMQSRDRASLSQLAAYVLNVLSDLDSGWIGGEACLVKGCCCSLCQFEICPARASVELCCDDEFHPASAWIAVGLQKSRARRLEVAFCLHVGV